MALFPLVGHQEARTRLQQAIAAGTLPQTILLAGPEGVGKQRLALWVAQRLLCEGPAGEPCGKCGPCHRVLNLGHPDVHWLVPIQRPKAGEPDKQADEAAETLAEIMEERRKKPLWGQPDGMWAHGVPSARLLLKRAVLTPMEAKKKVFIVGNAERLIAQIGTEDAPNALLKVLEEPPADTQFLLTAADPRRLLPTIRSRSIVVRLGRLSNEEVRGFLTTHAGLSPKVAEERAATADGSIGAALAEDGSAARHREAAVSVIDALFAGDGREFERALSQPPYQARGDFSGMLDALSQLLADAAREGTGGKATRPVPKSLKGRRVAALATASELVMAAREAAQGNVNPQLLLAGLALDLEEALCV
jgi:DNA polymerase-3 subunit delta'